MNLRRPARALDRDLRGPDARREVAEEALPEQRPPRRRSAAARELELPVRPVPRDLPLHMRHGPAILTPPISKSKYDCNTTIYHICR